MPIYEYHCHACGETMEKLRKISDPPLLDCPLCGKPDLQKKVTAAGFRLKGSGWYETDFKTDGKRNLAGDQDTGAKESGGSEQAAGKNNGDSKPTESTKAVGDQKAKADTKTESKTDSKADSKADTKSKSKTNKDHQAAT